MTKNKTVIGMSCAALCEFLYGVSYLFTKTATARASTLTLLAWRFFLAFVTMGVLVLTGAVKLRFRGKPIKKLVRIAVLFPGIYFVGETVGISHTTASESGAFLACIPAVSLLLSATLIKKKPSGVQIAGVAATLAGVLVTVLGMGLEASLSGVGYIMLTAAVISYALYSVCVEEAEEFNGAEITFSMLSMGCAVFVLAALMEGMVRGSLGELVTAPLHDPGLLKAVLYQGMGCSVGAFFMSNVAIACIGVNRTASFVGLSTVVSIVAGVAILHEHFLPMQVIGAVMIVGGVYLANSRLHTKKHAGR